MSSGDSEYRCFILGGEVTLSNTKLELSQMMSSPRDVLQAWSSEVKDSVVIQNNI